MPNRLSTEDSPYLLQHRNDPVDWYAWGDEAFTLARSQDKPVFLSVGYSACHWCHVMAHESFQDAEIAEALNRYFVSIKVDREERPDVDDAYMTAVQLATGHGGWPMSVFLTPEKKPFFAGTYFPRDARGDFPGFRTLVTSLGQAWGQQRAEIEESAATFSETLGRYLTQTAGPVSPSLDVRSVDRAVEELHEEFDFENGGFGTRPKFPPHATLRFLIEYAAQRHLLGGDEDVIGALTEQASHMALMTLEKMALGGIHDHVGGGFHRYSTDEEWRLPHFEKMLSDNAQLLWLYSMAAESSGDPCLTSLFQRSAEGIAVWLSQEMWTEDGLFMTAVDADSEGEEGVYYTWTVDEVERALGERAETFVQAFGLEKEGNFRDESSGQWTGRNVLKLDQDVEGAFDRELVRLRAARDKRERPQTDAKAIAAFNGLAIGGLARFGMTTLAVACAERWLSVVGEHGRLPHQVTNGRPKGMGFLDDHAYLADGLLDLYEATEDARWRDAAIELTDRMDALFREGDQYFATSREHETLFGRSVPALDHATPSALAVAARANYRLGRTEAARRTLLGSLGWIQRTTRATHSLVLLAFEDMVAHPGMELTQDSAGESGVRVSLDPREIVADRDGWGQTEVVIQVPAGMHINSNDPTAKWLVPTTLRVEGLLGEASFPVGEAYSGEVRIPVRLRAKSRTEEFQITVRFQPCSETACLLPQEVVVSGVVTVASPG